MKKTGILAIATIILCCGLLTGCGGKGTSGDSLIGLKNDYTRIQDKTYTEVEIKGRLELDQLADLWLRTSDFRKRCAVGEQEDCDALLNKILGQQFKAGVRFGYHESGIQDAAKGFWDKLSSPFSGGRSD